MLSGLSFMCFAAIIIKASHAPGIVTTFYRMAIGAAVLFIPFLIHSIKLKFQFPIKGIILAVLAGICFGIDMALWSTGVVASNATIPTLFANLAPIWVGIGSIFLFKEKHKFGFWLGLFIALTGISIIIFKEIFSANGIIYGALLGMAGGLFYAAFYLLTQPGRKLLDTLSFLFIWTFCSAIVLYISLQIFNYKITGYDNFTWLMFLAFGIGVQVIGWFLISYSQGYLPASIVAPTLLGQPVLTAFLAIIILKEQLTIFHIFGGLIVVVGIYIVHYSRLRKL